MKREFLICEVPHQGPKSYYTMSESDLMAYASNKCDEPDRYNNLDTLEDCFEWLGHDLQRLQTAEITGASFELWKALQVYCQRRIDRQDAEEAVRAIRKELKNYNVSIFKSFFSDFGSHDLEEACVDVIIQLGTAILENGLKK